MPNYCNFSMYAVGRKEDIERLNKAMEADYSYWVNKEFLKKLGIYNEDDWVFKDGHDFTSLSEVRRKANGLKDNNFVRDGFYSLYNKALALFNSKKTPKLIVNKEKVLDMLKDENLKKEYFNNIPKEHFYRVFDYYPDEDPEHLKDDIFIARSSGTCAWSVETCIVDSEGTGYYSDAKREYPKHILTGTNLTNFSKEVPGLKIAIISEEPAMEFSEFYTCVNGELVDAECEEYIEAWFDNVEEAAEQGVEIKEDEAERFIYLKFPEWYEGDRKDLYIDEGYILDKLGVSVD